MTSMHGTNIRCLLYQVLRQKLHRSFKNVRIVSNRMVFEQNGDLVSFKGILSLLKGFSVKKCLFCCASLSDLHYINSLIFWYCLWIDAVNLCGTYFLGNLCSFFTSKSFTDWKNKKFKLFPSTRY